MRDDVGLPAAALAEHRLMALPGRAVATLGVVLAGVVGCAPSSAGSRGATLVPPTTSVTPPAPSSSGSPTASTAPSGMPTAPPPSPSYKPFTGEAADFFGADEVGEAYRIAVEFTDATTFNGGLLSAGVKRDIDFAFAKPYMTPSLQKRYAGTVAGRAKDGASHRKLFLLTTFGVSSTAAPTRFPYSANKVFGAATSQLDRTVEPARLVLRFPARGDLLFSKDGKPVKLVMDKSVTLTLVPDGDPKRPWLVDSYYHSYTVSPDFLPDPKPGG